MNRYGWLFLTLLLSACGGSQPATPESGGSAVTLGWTPVFIGVAGNSCPTGSECLRAPNYNFDVPISQMGNPNRFAVSSSNPEVATGSIVMTGPGGQNDPAVGLAPQKAGTAVLTVTGMNGASAQLPVTVTTISRLTVTLNGLPTAQQMKFSVSAPTNANCPSFEGGYSFYADVVPAPSTSTILQNFPAMGTGPLGACIFSKVAVTVLDASSTTLAAKTVQLSISVGHDNPAAISIP